MSRSGEHGHLGGGESREAEVLEQVVGQALDVFVYAPIGLLFEGRSMFPQLVEKGRNQVAMARMIGQFAVRQGQAEAARAATKLQEQATGVLGLLGVGAKDGDPRSGPGPGRASRAGRPAASRAAAPVVAPAGPAVEDLSIPDYDSLSASQVVSRLPGLSRAELDAVFDYERANRGRKTILNRCAQLRD